LNEEIATEGIRREKLEELIDRMHAFQNTEIESSNALKLELKAQRDAVSRPESLYECVCHSRFLLQSIVASFAPGP